MLIILLTSSCVMECCAKLLYHLQVELLDCIHDDGSSWSLTLSWCFVLMSLSE
ncbi:hypothetical protein KC19_9G118600 [Ceratodon purpureus]|uniref:Uncharacterized protein n=1 Tax=Ceratodon purpureus TaxID=3225 RepID=A0A8T0GVD5_CERPU|nr:hypothetical protein KC19_9G118600 [Ceratodon purpureus]